MKYLALKELKNTKFTLFICILTIFISAILIGMFRVSETGVQWPEDGSRYLNNGAMIRDYILSDSLFSPYEFAKNNYIQYPGFSIPFHPPGYSFLLGVWFIIFGMSYVSGRFFIASMLGILGVYFFKILRLQRIPNIPALCCSLLMITSYEMVHWGRSTMSEIPALTFLMIGSFYFLKWVDSEKKTLCWLAFGCALIGFFCRVTSAGIIPAWFFYLIVSKRWKKLFSFNLIVPSFVYLLSGVFWTKFASQFAKNEIRGGLTDNLFSFATYDNFTIWLSALPSMIGALTLIVSILCLIFLVKSEKKVAKFWICWFVSYYCFQIMLVNHFEARYFFFSIPPFFAFVGGISLLKNKRLSRWFIYPSWVFIFVFNLVFFINMPNGVTGHDVTAQKLSNLKLPGNILLSCWNDADLIFRYRCLSHDFDRQLIRGDRTLAIRVSSYAGIAPKQIARNFQDVKNIIENGFIRYLVTSTSKNMNNDDRPADMIFAHETAISNPEFFTLLDKTKITLDFSNKRDAEIFIWRYEGKLNLNELKSNLPIIIPTANLKLYLPLP